MSATVYVVGEPCKPIIGRDLIDGLGLSIHGRGPQSQNSGKVPQKLQLGPHPTSFWHQAVILPNRDIVDTALVPKVVMKVMQEETPLGSVSVPGPDLTQLAQVPWTGRIGGGKTHMNSTVDMTRNTQMHRQEHACPEQHQNQWYRPVKPLFHVGSLVSAQGSHRSTGWTQE